MEIPVSADMVLRTENMDLQYRVLCCLPYSQGIVRSDTLLSVVTGSESEATKEPSFYHESAPSNDVSFDSCMLDGILVRKISLKAITLKKCGRTPLSHSEGPVNVYASWQLVADLGLPDLAYVLLFSPSGVARVVCLRAIHNSKPLDRTIFVPPDLSHNIGLNPDQSSPVELGLCDSIPKFPIASRIRLAASYLDEKICQLLLKRYFTRTKKYLVLNDVVCMPLRRA